MNMVTSRKIKTAQIEPVRVQLATADELETQYRNRAPIRQHPLNINIRGYRDMVARGEIQVPHYQRQEIYNDEKASLLFFSIMHGASIGLIEVAQRRSDTGTIYYDLINGLQRSNCIRRIAEGKVMLPTEKLLSKYVPFHTVSLISPGMRLPELNEHQQSDFWSYMLKINCSENIPVDQQGDFYILSNIAMPQTAGEKLWAFNSETNRFAKSLQGHAAWQAIYRANYRNTWHLASLGLIGLEMLPEGSHYAQLRDDELNRIAGGYYDDHLSDILKHRVQRRLDHLQHLFAGLKDAGRVSIIPMVQACRLLEEAGKDIYGIQQQSDDGVYFTGGLTKWLKAQKRIKNNNSSLSYSIVAHMADHLVQKNFWESLGQKHYLLQKYPHYS